MGACGTRCSSLGWPISKPLLLPRSEFFGNLRLNRAALIADLVGFWVLIPGTGGDIGYGADSVWPTVFEVPLTRIDAKTNRVVRQWIGKGGDSLRLGFGSLWITDYKKGLLSRIPIKELR
jgi:hypothetical protein